MLLSISVCIKADNSWRRFEVFLYNKSETVRPKEHLSYLGVYRGVSVSQYKVPSTSKSTCRITRKRCGSHAIADRSAVPRFSADYHKCTLGWK